MKNTKTNISKEKQEYLENFETLARQNCKHLYEERGGWECNCGWFKLLHDFSIKCEEVVNRFYRKYRYIIIVDQIKQKYGDLDIYCSISRDPGPIMKVIYNVFKWINEKIYMNVAFNYKDVVDEPSYKKHIINIYKTKESRDKSGFLECSNVKSYDINGRFLKVTTYDVYGKRHKEPTSHKVLYWVMRFCDKMTVKISNFANRIKKESRNEYVVRNYIDIMLNKFIKEAEEEAANTCELCGNHFNDSWDKRCETMGWVMNICEHCAKETGREYIKDNKVYKNGEFIRDIKKDW